MIIKDMIYLANAGRRKNARILAAQRWTVGVCVVTAATAMGVVTGILIAPKSGKETRAALKRSAVKSVANIKDEILEKTDAVKSLTKSAAKEVTDTIEGASA